MPPITVLVVDDSAFMRQVISRMLADDPGICVLGAARDGEDAYKKILRLKPDVVTLDLEMPKMDGLTLLAEIMSVQPTPVVVVSSWAAEGAEQTLRALELGAVDFVTKPVSRPSDSMWIVADDLLAKVKTAAEARVGRNAAPEPHRPVLHAGMRGLAFEAAVCCLAASTGGPRALRTIVTKLPQDFSAGVLLVQHMPKGFTSVFADRLNEQSSLPVREASDGDAVLPGQVLVAPAGLQTLVTGSPGRLSLSIGPEPATLYRPSADVTLDSIAESCGSRALGAVLTGMGQDGARGLLAMRRAGAHTMVESEESCVIYGMPRAARAMNAAEWVLPLWDMPGALVSLVGSPPDTK